MFHHLKCSGILGAVSVMVLQLGGSFSARADDDNKCTPPPAGLVSWWPGDGNAKDIVGQNTGLLFGGATFAPGFVGHAFRFNGSTAFVQATTFNMPTGNADRTLEMWVKLDATVPADNPTIAYFESFFAGYGNFGTSAAAFLLFAEHEPPYGNVLAWTQWFDQLAGPLLFAAQPYQDNHGWHHVAVTNLGGTNIGIVLFLDGVPVARRQGFDISTPAGTSFFMGRIPGPLGDIRRMKGELDEVSIYNRALAPHEIAAIFAAGKAGKCKPYWESSLYPSKVSASAALGLRKKGTSSR